MLHHQATRDKPLQATGEIAPYGTFRRKNPDCPEPVPALGVRSLVPALLGLVLGPRPAGDRGIGDHDVDVAEPSARFFDQSVDVARR